MDQHVHTEHDLDTATRRPVTERSRITGTDRRTRMQPSVPGDATSRHFEWAPVLASVVVGMAISAMLVILGIATGLTSGSENTDADGALGILSGVGAWTVVAMIIGAFAGSVLGGRLARWLDRGTLTYHALTSWAVATLLSMVMVCLVAIAFATTTTSAASSTAAADQVTGGQATQEADNAAAAANGAAGAEGQPDGTTAQNTETTADEAAETTADALGGAGLALTLAMLLTLAATVAGWWIGSRKRLTDFEREDADGRVVAA